MARQIVDAHPDYAQGHALYAGATWLLADDPYSYGDFPADKARRVAIAHARKAIRLAPGQADGYAALGLVSPPPDSLAPLRKAIALDRSRSSLRGNLGIDLNLLGRHDEAFEQYRLGVEIDPLIFGAQQSLRRITCRSGAARGGVSAKSTPSCGAAAIKPRPGASGASRTPYWGMNSEAIAARLRGLALDPQLPYQNEWLAMQFNLLGLDDQEARYRASLSRYLQLFLADDRGALRAQVLRDGAKAWSANKFEFAIFSLARARDWPAIVQVYDARPPEWRDLCARLPNFAPFIAMALERQGRDAEGARLLGCVQHNLQRLLAMRFRSPDEAPGELEMWQGSLLALRGDAKAFDWLDKAVARGWLGQYYSSNLADWPQFDDLRDKPRYSAIQRRIDARLARERAETLALLRPATPRP